MLKPLSIVLVIPLIVYVFTENLRITGTLFDIAKESLTAIFFIALTWTVWLGGNALAESIVITQHLRSRSIDSQLIRLGMRLFVLILAIAIIVEGSARLGLPAYSVLAGLGVGGIPHTFRDMQTEKLIVIHSDSI